MHVTKHAVKDTLHLVAQVLDARVAVTMPAAPLQHEAMDTPEAKQLPTGLFCFWVASNVKCVEPAVCCLKPSNTR